MSRNGREQRQNCCNSSTNTGLSFAQHTNYIINSEYLSCNSFYMSHRQLSSLVLALLRQLCVAMLLHLGNECDWFGHSHKSSSPSSSLMSFYYSLHVCQENTSVKIIFTVFISFLFLSLFFFFFLSDVLSCCFIQYTIFHVRSSVCRLSMHTHTHCVFAQFCHCSFLSFSFLLLPFSLYFVVVDLTLLLMTDTARASILIRHFLCCTIRVCYLIFQQTMSAFVTKHLIYFVDFVFINRR